jgi:flavin reductase (DIM6/NTAB) family NADH-FMN oxidoreductase RutF
MIHLNFNDIEQLDKQKRTNLINCLSGLRAANLIGTISNTGQTNLAIFNSVTHIGANPALMGFIQRPTSVDRHTYNNIKSTGTFTINHVNESIYKQAHQTSARFEAHESEFTKTGLTEFYSSSLKAPYVAESLVKIGLTFEEEIPIKSNNTILIIGKVMELMLNEDYLTESYLLDLSKTQNISVQGLETYYRSEKIAELAYAKTDLNILQKGQ